jgi:hypothetical protein
VLSLYTQANYTLDSLVIAMTQTQAMRLSLMRTDFNQKLFPDITKDGGSIEGIPVVTSENIVANGGSPADGALIAFINASDILLADDGGSKSTSPPRRRSRPTARRTLRRLLRPCLFRSGRTIWSASAASVTSTGRRLAPTRWSTSPAATTAPLRKR